MITNNKLRFVEKEENSLSQEEIRDRKKKLRAYMKERRGENENRDVKAPLLADNLLQALQSLEIGQEEEKTAFVYLSFSSEAPTDGLIETLLKEGWRIFCPRTEKEEMYAVEYGEDFYLSDYGIREPCGEVYEQTPTVTILPLLAVDEKGNRLGYGKGYYDRYLKKYPKTKRVGYCFDFQIVNEVPCAEEDERLEVIVTDKRILFTKEK